MCATCKRYWEGRERGLPRPQCTSLEACGSPIAGDTFSQYDGPMSDFTGWCFMCARNSDYAVKVREERRLIGVCREHVRALNDLIAVEKPDMASLLVMHSTAGRVPLLQLLPKPKKGLFQVIAETEAEFAAEDARKALA